MHIIRDATGLNVPAFHAQVASLTVGAEYNSHFESLYKIFVGQLQQLLPSGASNIPAAYEQGSDEDQAFVQNLAIFFTSFLRVTNSPCKADDSLVC